MRGVTSNDIPLITIAVICKNERANIERCLTSIIRQSADFSVEILVVDSYSSDGTIDLARQFPVTIVQLGQDWPHSPAAGRYTAVRHARGRYLLLIDGDMELLPGFLPGALAQFEADPSVVAVRGRLHNFYSIDGKFVYSNSKFATCLCSRDTYVDSQNPMTLKWASGSALFRLQAVREVGNFHPFLKAEEEYEIAHRLRKHGGKLIYIPLDAVNHYGYLPDPLAEVVRRLRRGLVGGAGQVFRLSLQEGYALIYMRRIRQHLLIGLFFLSCLPSLLLALIFPVALLIWFAFCLILIGAYWVKAGRLKSAIAAFLIKGLIGIDILKWAFIPVPGKETYPTTVKIINGTLLKKGGMG